MLLYMKAMMLYYQTLNIIVKTLKDNNYCLLLMMYNTVFNIMLLLIIP